MSELRKTCPEPRGSSTNFCLHILKQVHSVHFGYSFCRCSRVQTKELRTQRLLTKNETHGLACCASLLSPPNRPEATSAYEKTKILQIGLPEHVIELYSESQAAARVDRKVLSLKLRLLGGIQKSEQPTFRQSADGSAVTRFSDGLSPFILLAQVLNLLVLNTQPIRTRECSEERQHLLRLIELQHQQKLPSANDYVSRRKSLSRAIDELENVLQSMEKTYLPKSTED